MSFHRRNRLEQERGGGVPQQSQSARGSSARTWNENEQQNGRGGASYIPGTTDIRYSQGGYANEQQQDYNGPNWFRESSGVGERLSSGGPSYPISRAPARNEILEERASRQQRLEREPKPPGQDPYFYNAQFRNYHVPGYGGHVQTEQFEFGKSYGRITRQVLSHQSGDPPPGYKTLF